MHETVRRRILGKPAELDASRPLQPQPANVEESPAQLDAPVTAQPEAATVEESPAELLRLLAEVMKQRGVAISTVSTRDGGFLVSGIVGGAVVQQWYSAQEVRRAGALIKGGTGGGS
jgi:hypothetical protein